MYEAPLTHKSLSKQARFYWSMQQIHVLHEQNLHGEDFRPHIILLIAQITIGTVIYSIRRWTTPQEQWKIMQWKHSMDVKDISWNQRC